MSKNFLTVHMMVKNEDRFIWYAISSVLPFVDKILIYDTGSTDNTKKILNSLRGKKIIFEQKKVQDRSDIARIRQEQIVKTVGDWFWIVDGDETYPFSLCDEIVSIIKNKGDRLEGIVVRRIDLLGDIYHYQSENVGTYDLFGKKGHMAIRLINKSNIEGVKVLGTYPYEGYYDKNGREIIYHKSDKFVFTKGSLFHAIYLQRSTLGGSLSNTFHRKKWKIELGQKIPANTILPEVFSKQRPSLIPDVTGKRSLYYKTAALFITPIKLIKRKIWSILK